MSHINIYTDGASSGNPGPGGYGVVLEFGGHVKELSEGFRKTTNNRMELLAVIKGIEAIKKTNQKIVITSDSKYVIDSIQKNWLQGWVKKNFKNKKNEDLWRRYLKASEGHDIFFRWVKGHNGHAQNERCDELATTAAKGNNLEVDAFFEELSSKK